MTAWISLSRPAHNRAGLGIARTFQNIALFRGMTVLENIKLGAHARLKSGPFAAAFYLGKSQREEDALTSWIDVELIEFLHLEKFRDREIRRPALWRAEAGRTGPGVGDVAAPHSAG